MNDDELLDRLEGTAPDPTTRASPTDAGGEAGPEVERQLDDLRATTRSKRFLAASRTNLSIGEIATWDEGLVREFRLLVPIDVQALVVDKGSNEPMVRLPMLLADEPGADPGTGTPLERSMPPLFDEGRPRPPGVHLHWAMPDALLRGEMSESRPGSTNRLGLATLPDRWVVVRLGLAADGTEAVTRGWILEADRAAAVDLDGWTEDQAEAGDGGRNEDAVAGIALEAGELTGTVGGSVTWAATYDAVTNRFAFHDGLDDLDPGDVDNGSIAYLVAGWWSDPAADPIDDARSTASLDELLAGLGWRLHGEWGTSRYLQELNDSIDALRSPLGLASARRYDPDESAGGSAHVPFDRTLTSAPAAVFTSPWAEQATEYLITEPWHLRSCLLHGAVYGVPIDGDLTADRRPDPSGIRVALGEHDGDVLAALGTVPGAPPGRRRDSERLLQAFAAQKINRLGSPEGVIEIESEEHRAGFASQPGGIAGTDRFLQRARPGRAGGTRFPDLLDPRLEIELDQPVIGGLSVEEGSGDTRSATDRDRPARGGGGARALAADVTFSQDRYQLEEGVGSNELAAGHWQTILGAAPDRTAFEIPPTEPRVVQRPAPRFTFPADPMLAVQGAGRSLRHANDGRASPDGKLTCRWPAQVISADEGLIDGADVLRSLGNGSIPPEVLSLAREVLIHDPYHTGWLARVAAKLRGVADAATIRLFSNRLVAEAGLRYGVDAVYDGSTQAFARLGVDKPTRRGAAGRPGLADSELTFSPSEQAEVADRAATFSLAAGADPDPVGVTLWSQPWIPLWVEWEVAADPPADPTIAGWELGAVDLETDGPPAAGRERMLRGRAVLTSGAATTLRRAVKDWLAAEDAREAADPALGQADEETEAALARLARAVTRTDTVTASLDGVIRQLLGFGEGDLVRLSDGEGGVRQPVPVREPNFLTSGRFRLSRARLVDAFGRHLELPVGDVRVTVQDTIKGEPGHLAVPPRLTRPARWRFRLVDAASRGDRRGVEARVDQVDPTLQVNPVAGFLLPDHLDESLEVFDTAGRPLGELLTGSVGGGVIWERAPGTEGPPSAGPHLGLAPEQRVLGQFATGLIAADRRERQGGPARGESALAAFLRAVDTTLWTVDTYASLGGEHIAGLVGRPIAVVRAQLHLELRPPDRVDLSDPAKAAWWEEEERRLRSVPFPVRLGELTRLDDGLLGFFLDDDYERFRPVDKVVAALAHQSGRHTGQLGLIDVEGEDRDPMPPRQPILHPYVTGPAGLAIDDSDTFRIHLGQTATLTLLLHPGGVVHLTSGILPRIAVALARDWVAPGLGAIAPSLRTGPILVETDLDAEGQVRLPKVSVLGQDQDLWWRDTPGSWRSDAILAATQSALLPDTPAQFREGWIRVRPTDATDEGADDR